MCGVVELKLSANNECLQLQGERPIGVLLINFASQRLKKAF